MTKTKTVAITIDPNTWAMAKEKIPGGRSKFIQKQLEIAIGLEESEEAKLQKEIVELQEEINVRQARLCQIREEKRKQANMEMDFTEVEKILRRFEAARGFVAENQLRQLSARQDIDYDILYNLAAKMGIEIKRYYEPPHEGRMKNSRLR